MNPRRHAFLPIVPLFLASCGGAGVSSLVLVTDATEGDCPNGGSLVRTGLDEDGDGVLHEDEVQQETAICHGADGTNGAAGDDGANGADGANGEDGTDGTDGEDAACYDRTPVRIDDVTLVDDAPYERGAAYTLRVDAEGDDLTFTLVGTGAALESALAPAGDAYEGQITFATAGGPYALAVVADDGCTLDTYAVTVDEVVAPPAPMVFAIAGEVGCAIAEPPGPIQCWGNRNDDIIDAGLPSGDFVDVDVSYDGRFGCALDTDGSPTCWGDESAWYGIIGQVNGATGAYAEIVVGTSAVCGVDASDGTVDCWGAGHVGDVEEHPGPLSGLTMARDTPICALEADGSLACFGNDEYDDYYGQLSGPNDSTGTYRKVVNSSITTCGLRTDGTADCWGPEYHDRYVGRTVDDLAVTTWEGQCAVIDGYAGCETIDGGPVRGGFQRVEAAGNFACAVHESNKLACWGNDTYGQLDLPNELALLP